MIVPYRVCTLTCRSPWANLAILAANVVMFLLIRSETLSKETFGSLVLFGWSPLGLFGHQFVHLDFFHLFGNMLTLWVFGNAINGVLSDWEYLLSYLACGLLAAALHIGLDGHPAIGASGAICGLLGLYLAIYPQNEVNCFYWFFSTGTFDVKGYILVIGWFLWDLTSAMRGVPGIAHWAHIGGTLAGFGIGIILLKLGRVYLGEYDNPTMLDLISRHRAEG